MWHWHSKDDGFWHLYDPYAQDQLNHAISQGVGTARVFVEGGLQAEVDLAAMKHTVLSTLEVCDVRYQPTKAIALLPQRCDDEVHSQGAPRSIATTHLLPHFLPSVRSMLSFSEHIASPPSSPGLPKVSSGSHVPTMQALSQNETLLSRSGSFDSMWCGGPQPSFLRVLQWLDDCAQARGEEPWEPIPELHDSGSSASKIMGSGSQEGMEDDDLDDACSIPRSPGAPEVTVDPPTGERSSAVFRSPSPKGFMLRSRWSPMQLLIGFFKSK
eukprot:RCo016387